MKVKKISLVLICYLAFVQICFSQSDSTAWKDKKIVRQFNFGFTLLSLEYGIPFESNEFQNLPYGMNYLLQNPKSKLLVNIAMPSIVFRDRLGIAAKIFTSAGYNLNTAEFLTYLQNKFPNYYIPTIGRPQLFFTGFTPILFYRAHFGKWKLEPFIELLPTSNVLPTLYLTMRQQGSNQFIEYSITDTTNMPVLLKGIGFNFVYRFKKKSVRENWELFFTSLYRFGKINGHYVIKEQAFGMPATIAKVDFSLPFSDFSFGLGLRLFLKK